ncbi:MAG: carboxypeptidase-like regulatory domain-containing protein, partial [Thermoanaerobaculia bacterium]
MRRSLEALLAVLLLAGLSRPAMGAAVSVRAELREADPKSPVRGVLRLVPRAEGQSGLKPVEIPFQVPGRKSVELAAGTLWQARIEAGGYWGEAKLILPEKSADGATLRVFPAGSLQGRVVAPEAQKPPASLSVRVRFTPAPGRKEALDETVECPVRDGMLDCKAPAGVLDLRLRTAEGFVPIYLWGQRVEPGKTAKVGDLRLLRGASVSGWVETAEGKPLPEGCKVTLAPQTASDLNLSVNERLQGSAFEARANERGFFQLSGIPPGRYVLTAQQSGFSPAVLAPVEVRTDLESQIIERLVLTRPVSLEIAVHPPLEPYGMPWRITLARKDAPSERPREVFKGAASEEGLWKSPPIPQGMYELSVAGDLDTVWHSEFLEVGEGEPPVSVEVPVLEVRGTIRLGKKPLATSFWLGREKGQRVRFDADEDGRFEGVLPGPGKWIPALASGSRPAVAFDPIEVRKPQGKRYAEIEIAVPDTRLKGEVVDESGRPVPGSRITVMLLEKDRKMIQLQSDDKGAFSLEGSPPGEVELQAEHEEAESDFVAARLEDGVESPPVSLVIRHLKGFPGRVVSSGAVAGALVRAFPVSSGSASFRMDEDVSGPDGRFEL